MRILIGSLHGNLVGGTEKYLETIIPGLLFRGHEVAIAQAHRATPGLPTIDPLDSSVPVWSMEDLGRERLCQRISEWRPDLVYSNGLEEAGVDGAMLGGLPTVVFAHDYKGTCISGRKCHSFPRVTPCSRTFGPECLALYYPRHCGGLNPQTMLRRYQEQLLLLDRVKASDVIVVASRHMQHEYVRHGVRAEKIRLLRLPIVDNAPLAAAPAARIPGGHLLFVSRLTDQKGGRYLIAAIPKAAKILGRRLTLTVAGDGAERSKLEKLAMNLGVSAHFLGWVESRQKLELMRQADLLAVPSVWPEPFGLVGIEAGCLGVPAVGYAVGGIPDWLIPGHSGELAPADPPSVEGLAAAIVRALEDRARYARLCRGAWETSRGFTVKSHLDQLETIFGEVHSKCLSRWSGVSTPC